MPLNKEINKVVSNLQRTISEKDLNDFSALETYPLFSNQCLYVYSFLEDKILYSKKPQLLGFSKPLLKENVTEIHPNDVEVYAAAFRVIMEYLEENKVSVDGFTHSLCYRIKKQDGTYARVLRNTSPFELDDKGRLLSNLTILTDISFMKIPNQFHWEFIENGKELTSINELVYGEIRSIYSKRELQIVTLLLEKQESKQIAIELNISRHTVDTHRRKLLKKSGCKNTSELIEYAIQYRLVY